MPTTHAPSSGFIDAHCHLDDTRFDPGRDGFIAAARTAGISRWIVAGIDPEQWDRAEALAAREPGVVPVLGLHPWAVTRMAPEAVAAALANLRSRPSVGLGETGLDNSKYVPRGSLPAQREAFVAQLRLARELDRPVVLHILGAHGEALQILESEGVPATGGMVHSYSGSAELVPRYEALGLCLSFAASITRPTSRRSLEAAVRTSPHRLMVETDCPDQPPSGRDGGLNQPAWLWDVAEAVGLARGETAEAVLERSSANVRRLFRLDYQRVVP